MNIPLISVTADTIHDPIGPCEPLMQLPTGDSSMHASTAARSFVLLWGANAALTATNHSEPACLGCAHGGGLHMHSIYRLIHCDGHLPLQELDKIKRAVNKNDKKVIPICELCVMFINLL